MKTPAQSMPASQQGVAVILLFTILFMAGASLFISFASNNVLAVRNADQSGDALREAKAALIAYAVMHGDQFGAAGAGPGHLPCPDTNNDTVEDAPCGNNAIGRLPQSVTVPLPLPGTTIQFSDYNYGVDQQLWYGLTNAARRSPSVAFNTSTATTHTLDGQAVAAVLIAPGPVLGSQSRPSNNRVNYLEGGNAAGNAFVSSDGSGPENFNDRTLGISMSEIMTPVTARIAETVKGLLDTYHGVNGQYPPDNAEFAIAVATAPAWFAANNWNDTAAVTTYTQLSADTASLSFTGCAGLSYTLDNAAGSIVRTGTRC